MPANEKRFCVCLQSVPGTTTVAGNERAAVLTGAKWPIGSTISCTFIDGSADLHERVKAYAEEWVGETMANLSLAWVNDDAATIRISFLPGDGSWSYLGTVALEIPSPKPTMNYGWLTDDSSDEEVREVVLHEFGHALGMIHEHQNPEGGIDWDREAVIDELSGPPNNWDLPTIEHNIFKKYDVSEVEATNVDAESIMMYVVPESWTNDGFSAGLNTDLSDLDRSLIRAAYPWQ